jgi:methylmalonyl-CoA carboxyltransferase small subunit
LKLKVTIEGKTYEVEVEALEAEQRRPGYIPPAAGAPPTRASAAVAAQTPPAAGDVVADENKVCRSPIAGIVVKVSAQVGQAIQANDVLITLEAMKMETTITSPVAGKIAKVNAAVGDAVQGGQVLIEFE